VNQSTATVARVVAACAIVTLVAASRLRSADPPKAEWRAYAGNLAGTRYSPADQINKDNVSRIAVAWRQSLTPDEIRQSRPGIPPAPGANQTTPIMVGGLLYYSTGNGWVVAIDAATGKVVWFDSPPPATTSTGSGAAGSPPPPVQTAPGGQTARGASAGGVAATAPPGRGGAPAGEGATPGGTTRSLAYWTDGKDERIIALVGGRNLVALNAKTGKRYPDFGDGGQVDLRKGQERNETFSWRTGPTVIVKDVVIIGSNITDINNAQMESHYTMPPGDVRGIDVRTGRQLWLWHSIPRPGEVGNETWLNDSWAYTGNVNVWGAMSGDEDLGLVYLPGNDAEQRLVRRRSVQGTACSPRASSRSKRKRER
jgi:quinoprotein glucose dehydrogenase